MEGRSRFWGAIALASLFIGLAVLLDRPALLLGSTLLFGWLLAKGAVFAREGTRLDTGLTVSQSVSPGTIVTDEVGHGTLQASKGDHSRMSIAVEASIPPSVRHVDGETTVELGPGERAAETAFSFEPVVAGRLQFDRPSVEVSGPDALFRETLARGESVSLQVEPSAPRDLHVGTGGDEMAATYGDHESDRLGTGIEPAEIREYVPGDAARRIDWKATARLGEAYVREFEAETDRSLLILVDHGASLGIGSPGRTKLDYLREVALGIVTTARRLNDPIALFTFSDDDLAGHHRPGATNATYESARLRLHDIEPSDGQRDNRQQPDGRPLEEVRETARRLAQDETAFGATLRPYFTNPSVFVERLEGSPLFHTARVAQEYIRSETWTVILTDDRNRSEIRETVRLASRHGAWVLVFLTPTVLYAPGALDRIEEAYDAYHGFEEFRRELAGHTRVEAFEVAPGDRLSALLDAHRSERTARGRH